MEPSYLTPESFHILVGRLLETEGYNIEQVKGRSHDIGVDYLVRDPVSNEKAVVKWLWSSSGMITRSKFYQSAQQIAASRILVQADYALLVVASDVTAMVRDSVKEFGNIRIWDRRTIFTLLDKHPRVRAEFGQLVNLQIQYGSTITASITRDTRAAELLAQLATLDRGEEHWKRFEDLAIDMLNYVFIPPLGVPDIQSWSEDGLDRRDAIYPIRPGHIFWDGVRSDFRSRMLVAEFKNLTGAPGQKEVESIQQYLYGKAMRSFGILCSREAPSDSALKARRRAWQEFDKMIVILCDADLVELLELRCQGGEPSLVLETQIDDFCRKLAP